MSVKYYISFFLFVLTIMLTAFSAIAQQLKLGNNPTSIERSAVLQLDSKNQGLLLTRVPDFDAINDLDPPDGMIIYFTDGKTKEPYGPDAGVYQRRKGQWERLAKAFVLDSVPSGPDYVAFTVTDDSVILHLPYASATTRGIVSTRSQTFAGDKNFGSDTPSDNYHYVLKADSILWAYKTGVKDTLALLQLPNTDTLAFLTTDANGLVKLDTLDNVFWLTNGNEIDNPAVKPIVGTANAKDLSVITNDTSRLLITSEGNVGIGTDRGTGKVEGVNDMLSVNGSFKLGRGGSSFSAMRDTVLTRNVVIDDGGLLGGLLYYTPYVIDTWEISGIRQNAHVIVNPRSDLIEGNKEAIISWVRAEDGEIHVCFYLTSGNGIAIDNVTFDVYYVNSNSD